MKNILVICPSHRDRRELLHASFTQHYNIIFHDYSCDQIDRSCFDASVVVTEPDVILNHLIEFSHTHDIDAVLSTDDYPGASFASIVAQKCGFIAPAIEPVLLCQHKYYARQAQQRLVPEATPLFGLVEHDYVPLDIPFFVKPVKSFFSAYAEKVNTLEHFNKVRTTLPPENFFAPFNTLLKNYSTMLLPSNYLLAEELLEGHQVTVEGFIFKGAPHILGVVDSIMYPGTIAFESFIYPSALTWNVQKRMHDIAVTFMHGVGFDNGFFNIEMMYNPGKDSIHIIEVNPRMASQFADLYEKVDGVNSYSMLLAISLGQRPITNHRKGDYACAASFPLRVFNDCMVQKIPTIREIDAVYEKFPGIRVEVLIEEGHRLSEYLQDGQSYRYAVINIGAQSKEELTVRLNECTRLLNFNMKES